MEKISIKCLFPVYWKYWSSYKLPLVWIHNYGRFRTKPPDSHNFQNHLCHFRIFVVRKKLISIKAIYLAFLPNLS